MRKMKKKDLWRCESIFFRYSMHNSGNIIRDVDELGQKSKVISERGNRRAKLIRFKRTCPSVGRSVRPSSVLTNMTVFEGKKPSIDIINSEWRWSSRIWCAPAVHVPHTYILFLSLFVSPFLFPHIVTTPTLSFLLQISSLLNCVCFPSPCQHLEWKMVKKNLFSVLHCFKFSFVSCCSFYFFWTSEFSLFHKFLLILPFRSLFLILIHCQYFFGLCSCYS